MDLKRCTQCLVEKPISDFYPIDGGLNTRCKYCVNEYQRGYYRKNRARLLEYSRQNKRNYRKRWRSDPFFSLREKVRKAIAKALKGIAIGNPTSGTYSPVFALLPYSPTELKEHLERQFEPWMNWDNWGMYRIKGDKKWQIDHIIPQSKLPFDSLDHPNFLKSWDLSNLRPLEALTNISTKSRP